MTEQYALLLPLWESKVAYYATGNPNLFGSEYGFDSTGFEATQAFAKYAITHAGSDAAMGSANPALFLRQTSNFMSTEVAANMFDRGFMETDYYHYGSDLRSGGSDNFCLSYMTQMGGWGLLDYALNYATNYPGLSPAGLWLLPGRMGNHAEHRHGGVRLRVLVSRHEQRRRVRRGLRAAILF